MAKRVSSVWPHQPARLGVTRDQLGTVVAVLALNVPLAILPTLMDKDACDSSRASVEILVRAPAGEVDAPVV